MQYIIGCDIGTTRAKAVAFTLDGEVIAAEDESYPMDHPCAGWSEQDPVRIAAAAKSVIGRLLSACAAGGSPEAIAFSAAMHGLMALDDRYAPVTPLMIWADNRSGALADALRGTAEGRRQYQRTGVPVHAMTPASKFLWLRQYQPQVFKEAAWFAGIKDYVIYQLTGQLLTDYSMAAAMGLLQLGTLAWDETTLASLELEASRLPRVVSPYYTLPAAGIPGLSGVPVVVGASDGCLANLGSGATSDGTMALTIGTSGAIRRTSLSRYIDPEMRTFCYPLDERFFIVGGPTNNGAVVLQWLKENFFSDLTYEAMLEGAGNIEAGAGGLVFFPYLLGERAPIWDSAARGVFHGIDISHTRFHFARAVMEGILFNINCIGQLLVQDRLVHTIYANGGFAQSDIWVQMAADIFGIRIALNATHETGCAGAALVGLKALGRIRDFSDAPAFTRVSRQVDPRPAGQERYQALFAGYLSLMERIPLRPAALQ